jgi:histidine ammonia-lyase
LRHSGADDPRGAPAAELLAGASIVPLSLAPKEGLSLINGTEPMQVLLALAVAETRLLVRVADLACAMSIEGLLGTDRAYDSRVIDIRPHPGQLTSADNLRRLLAGSGLLASHRHDLTHAVQDSYSLRCAPQVHGAVRDVLAHVERVLTIELGSVVDNPVIVPTADGAGHEVMSTGNFHGEPLAFAGDMLAIAAAELGGISERRTDRMLDPAFSRGLPPFLAIDAGTNSGYMLAQYTAASLVSRNKILTHPSSVDTIPTSGNQEDHVSMGWTSMTKLHDVLRAVRSVLSVELVCGAQAIDLRASVAAPSAAIAAAHARLRSEVPSMNVDREVTPQLVAVDSMLAELVAAAETASGPLA